MLIRNAGDGTTIAHSETDATGTAVFPTLAVSAVRVAVQGKLPDGTALVQPGLDAEGIAFYLGAASNRLDLRVVLPDPQTMLAPDVGIADPAPTVAETVTLVSTTTPRPTLVPPTVAPVIAVDSNDVPVADAPTPSPFGWLLLVMLSCGLLAVFVVFLLPRRGA